MTTEPTHTPTPWNTGKTKLGDGAVYDANDKCVCVIVDPNKADIETAAFIVRAVNSHEELIEALKGILNSTDCNLDDQSDETSQAMKKAYDVIAKAEGK